MSISLPRIRRSALFCYVEWKRIRFRNSRPGTKSDLAYGSGRGSCGSRVCDEPRAALPPRPAETWGDLGLFPPENGSCGGCRLGSRDRACGGMRLRSAGRLTLSELKRSEDGGHTTLSLRKEWRMRKGKTVARPPLRQSRSSCQPSCGQIKPRGGSGGRVLAGRREVNGARSEQQSRTGLRGWRRRVLLFTARHDH